MEWLEGMVKTMSEFADARASSVHSVEGFQRRKSKLRVLLGEVS